MFKLIIISTIALSGQALAQLPAPWAAKLTVGQALFREPKVDARLMHDCQPLKGDTVTVIDIKRNLDGMIGVDLAHVRIVDGQCTGQEGWVGLSRLEAVPK